MCCVVLPLVLCIIAVANEFYSIGKKLKDAKRLNTKTLKIKRNDLTNAFFCDIITERENKTHAKDKNMHSYASRKDISPNGEDTHTLRLTSQLVDLRVGYAKWIRRAEARRATSKKFSVNMMHAVASYLRRDIEVVITRRS